MLLKKAIVVVTGPRGVGKSFFAATYAKPSEVGLVYYDDSERSGNRTVQELESAGLEFGYYNDLESRHSAQLPDDNDLLNRIAKGDLPWASHAERSALEDYYDYVVRTLNDKLTPDKFKVYVHDTLEKLEAGMVAYVQSHRGYGKTGWNTQDWGEMWTAGVYGIYRGLMEAIFSRGVETIILTSHLRYSTIREGRKTRRVPGKVEPTGKPLLYKLASLMIWLVNADNPDRAPAGIIVKERLGKLRVIEDTWAMQRLLPERIPHCVWWEQPNVKGSIQHYLEHGCDFTNPALGETMSPAERDMTSQFLSDPQMKLMMLMLESENGKAVGSLMDLNPKIEAAKVELQQAGITADNFEEVIATLVSSKPPPIRKEHDSTLRQAALELL